MLFYGVVCDHCSEAIKMFVRRDDAETHLLETLETEPSWRSILSVEELELDYGCVN